MPNAAVAGLSLIMQTNEEVDQAADLCRAIGLEVDGEDGYVEVAGPSIRLSIMRGAGVDVPRNGGVLLEIAVDDVAAATNAARRAGATIAREPTSTGPHTVSAFVQSAAGFTIELQTAASAETQ